MATAATPPDGPAPANKPVSRVVSEGVLQTVAQAMTGNKEAVAAAVGKAGTFQKLGFAGVVCAAFWIFQSDSISRSREDRLFIQEQARQDRVMFRDGLDVMHKDSERKWTAINDNQKALVETGRAVIALQQTTADMGRAVQALQQTTAEVGEAVKDLRTDLRRGGLARPKPKSEPESRGGEVLPMPKEAGG